MGRGDWQGQVAIKTCPDCGQSKPTEDYYKRSDGLPTTRCKVCHNAKTKAWRKANPERDRELKRKYRQAEPADVRARRLARGRAYQESPEGRARRAEWVAGPGYRAHLERTRERRHWRRLGRLYGIGRDDFDALVLAQSGLCAICSRQLDAPHVDHDHTTGRVRGLLCPLCNQALGLLGDSATAAHAAATYLEAGGSR